ncbi:MAG: GAF domain-containing protein [Opitutaceae bacterium]|nr:GAF domain-containing protein [Opitutaceae bacterium]
MADTPASSTPPPEPVIPERDVLATLYRISALAGSLDSPGEAMSRIVDEIGELFHADAAALALINPDTTALEVECSRGYPDVNARMEIPPGIGLLGWVAVHHRPLVVPDVATEPRHLPLRPNARSLMTGPLEVDGQFHGVVVVESDEAGRYHEAHLAVFTTVVHEAASVLRRLWAVEHLRLKAGQLEILGNVARELAAKLAPGELMETLTRESHRLAHCRLASLQLYDAGERRVRLQAYHPPGDHFRAAPRDCAIEDSLAGSAISTRRQVEYSNIQQHEFLDLLDIPAGLQVVSVLCTPLIVDGEVVGVLNVYTDRLHRFANDERRLFKALANLAAVALQNARLYQRVFESEESLRQNDRLTTLGLLAAEIAHETRNPLTVIRLLFGALALDFPADDPRRTDVAIIREKLDQLEQFVTRVLAFGKAPESLHTRWGLDDIIRETCHLLRLKLNQAGIHMHYEPSERPIVIDCNKGQIQQVLLNVILNATHAMPEGGSITIRSRKQLGDGPATAVVDITDTGHGIPPEIGDKIFESFLSGRTGGTGLGLAIAKRIMRSHHGDIEVAETSDRGTTMRLSLPAAP